jgi:glutamine phosphoribosylpyrophosphate amidotransferase
MSDATGRWVISFNGEIYNHCALRSELESLGCVFQTSSDTEVLINVLAHGVRRAFASCAARLRCGIRCIDSYGLPEILTASNRSMFQRSGARFGLRLRRAP